MRITIISVTLVLASLVSATLLNAQSSSKDYIEFEKPISATYFNAETFGENGIIASYRDNCSECSGFELHIEFYNKSFKLESEERFNYKSKEVTSILQAKGDVGQYFFMLYKNGEFKVLAASAEKQKVETTEGMLFKNFYPSKMEIFNDYALITGRIKSTKILLAINIITGDHNVIKPTVSSKGITIQNFQKVSNEKMFVYFQHMVNKNTVDLYAMEINNKGEKVTEFKLFDDPEKYFISATGTDLGNGKYAFVGTYNIKSTGLLSKATQYANGIYYALYKGEPTSNITYYNFTDFENFLKYLPENTQAKIEKKQEKKEAKGQELKMNYLMACHPLQVTEDGLYFIGEAYYPTYRTETYTTYTNGRAVTSTRQVFDGYQYTHAMVCKLKENGELEWDQIFEMSLMYKPFRVVRFLAVNPNEKGFRLAFSTGTKLYSMTLDKRGEIDDKKESEDLVTAKSDEKIKYSVSEVSYWYDNYFLASGTVNVKEGKGLIKAKSKKFYFSKLKI